VNFLRNVGEFRKLQCLPCNVRFDLDDLSAFVENGASWHKTCYLKFNNTKLDRERNRPHKRPATRCATGDPEPSRPKRQRIATDVCFFCLNGGTLSNFSTMEADRRVRMIAAELADDSLLSRLSGGGDLIAMDTSLASGTEIFKLSELHSLYTTRLSNQGISTYVHRTRLKERILEHFPDCTEQSDGKNVLLIFDQCMKVLLQDAVKVRNFTDDALIPAKAAKIICRDLFYHRAYRFNGSFPHDGQNKSVPSSLLSIISFILNGPNIKGDAEDSQATLSVAQVIAFNAKKIPNKSKVKPRHSLDREPPLPIYIGLNVHSRTRCKAIIKELHRLGLCISHNRVLEIECTSVINTTRVSWS